MFDLDPIFKRQAKPSPARTPSAIRRAGKGRKELTTITADPLLADPLMAAPMLTTWDVTGPDGVYLGAFQGSTPDDAILSYVATQGYASIDDAALAMGFADAMTFAASFIVTETMSPAGMDPSLAPVDPLAAPAALSRRRGRKSSTEWGTFSDPLLTSIAQGLSDAWAAFTNNRTAEQAQTSRDTMLDLREQLFGLASAEAVAFAQLFDDVWIDYANEFDHVINYGNDYSMLSKRGRRGRKSPDDVRFFLISLGPDTVEATVLNLWGATSAEMDDFGDVWVEGAADSVLPFQMTEDDLYVLATNLGYTSAPTTLSRRGRKSAEHLQSLVDIALPGYGVIDYTPEGLAQLMPYIDAEYAVLNSTDPLTYGHGRGEYLDTLKVAVQTELDALLAAAPAMLSRRRRKFARKGAYMVAEGNGPASGPYEAGTPEEAVGMWVAELGYGSADDAAAVLGYDSTESFLANVIATEAGVADPAATLSDDEMMDDEETPAEIARRRRSRKSDAGTVIAALGTVAFGGMLAYSVGALISDAYESLMAWWNEPSSEERTATLQADLVRLRDIESQLIAQAAAETNEIYLRETNSALGLVQNAIVALEAELANPSGVLSARSRRATARRLALKAAFTVADATTGDVLGTYDATTSDDAILSYVAEAGFETIEAAAAGMGFATVEEFLASISVAEGAEAEAAPAETPAETLSRRHRLMRKATFDVADPTTGEILGTFDAGTIDDAILSYAASLGFASADEAAAAAGVTVEEWLATFTITEATPAADAPPAEAEDVMEDEDEEDMPPAAASRR
jgi:hypothetical protein